MSDQNAQCSVSKTAVNTYDREQPSVDTTNALFLDDRRGSMYETLEPRTFTLSVVDELGPAKTIEHFNISFLKRAQGSNTQSDFIVSEGVTANNASIIPAPRPAARLRAGVSLP
jgi:hypothetical protein